MAGLNLDRLRTLQSHVKKHMREKGFDQDSDDAAQEYALRILEGKSRGQLTNHFCIDYVRAHFTGRGNKKGESQWPKRIYFSASEFEDCAGVYGRAEIENEVEYKEIMRLIFNLKNLRHRRILIMRFLFDLDLSDIAAKERINTPNVSRQLKNALKSLRAHLVFERPITP